MFSKVSKSEPKSSTSSSASSSKSLTVPKIASAGVAPSIVSANLRVTGDLESEGDIQIDGYVEGDVRSNSVTVGEHAVVCGAILSQSVRVAGTVKGQINGKTVELSRSAKVTGDIVHESLAIEAGAFIQGLCRHAESAAPNGKAAETNGHDNADPEPEKQAANGSRKDAEADVDDDAAKSAIAASAAKGQDAIKKVFR